MKTKSIRVVGIILCVIGLGGSLLCAQSTGTFNTVIASNDFRQMSAGYTNYFTGLLGVGLTTPQEQLHVNGNVKTEGYIIESTANGAVVVTHDAFPAASNMPSYATIVGRGAYYNSTNGNWSTTVGANAGAYANYGTGPTFLGTYAGAYSTNLAQTVAVGYYAGRMANACSYSVMDGAMAGYYAKNCDCAVFVGNYAGNYGHTNNSSVFVGANAGNHATNCERDVFLGMAAGYYNPPVTNSVALGYYTIVAADSTVVLGNGCDVVVGGTQASDAKVLLSKTGSGSFAGSGSFSNGITYTMNLGDISMGTFTNSP